MTTNACSITRQDLGPHRNVAIFIPLIFFVTSLVVDYVMYSLMGFEAFSDASTTVVCLEGADNTGADCVEQVELGAGTGLVFFICIMAKMMTFILVRLTGWGRVGWMELEGMCSQGRVRVGAKKEMTWECP